MPLRKLSLGIALSVGLAGAAQPVMAEGFDVYLGGRKIGRIEYDGSQAASAGIQDLHSLLDNTPLGVADGTFEASSRPVRLDNGEVLLQYIGRSELAKSRVISVLLGDGIVRETTINPTDEMTDLSDPANVPAGVVDPVEAFGRLVRSTGCPVPFRMYDGRRVVDVTVTGATENGDTVDCSMDYRVVAGPGHLSPLGFTDMAMVARYDLSDTAAAGLTMIEVRVGIFSVRLQR